MREVKVAASYIYVNALIGEIEYRCKADNEKTILKERLPPVPPSLASGYVKLEKKLCW